MLFSVATGTSDVSEGEAFANAMSAAVASGEGAESVHIIVMSIAQLGDTWQVVVKVVIEPRAEASPAPDLGLEEEEAALRHKRANQDLDEDMAVLIHFYVLPDHEDFLIDYMRDFALEHSYYHVIPEGSLWDEAVNYFPDVEFYEAAHAVNVTTYDTSAPATRLELEHYVANLKKNQNAEDLEPV